MNRAAEILTELLADPDLEPRRRAHYLAALAIHDPVPDPTPHDPVEAETVWDSDTWKPPGAIEE